MAITVTVLLSTPTIHIAAKTRMSWNDHFSISMCTECLSKNTSLSIIKRQGRLMTPIKSIHCQSLWRYQWSNVCIWFINYRTVEHLPDEGYDQWLIALWTWAYMKAHSCPEFALCHNDPRTASPRSNCKLML